MALNLRKPSALCGADLHWRIDNPICRTDDFVRAQKEKGLLAKSICEKYNIPMLVAGDIFEYSKNWPELIRIVLKSMPDFICIPGQHDLPKHNLELFTKSSLSVIEAAGKAIVLLEPGLILDPSELGWPNQTDWLITGFPFGVEPKSNRRRMNDKRMVCMIHQLVTEEKDPFPGANAEIGSRLLEKLVGYDLIISGDNHQQFVSTLRDKLLINSGSMSRQDARQINFQPKFYLWFAEDNSYEEINIPIDKSVVIQTHLETKKERENRIDAYIDAMEHDYEIKLDFKTNLELHIKGNDVDKETEQFIWGCLEG